MVLILYLLLSQTALLLLLIPLAIEFIRYQRRALEEEQEEDLLAGFELTHGPNEGEGASKLDMDQDTHAS